MVCVPMGAAGVTVTTQLAVPITLCASVHGPILSVPFVELTVTVPEGVDTEPLPASTTVMVKLVPWPIAALAERGLMVVEVARVVTLKGELVAPVKPALVEVSVYPTPALLIDRSAKVATPATAACVGVPLSVPPDGLVPIAIVTLAVLVVRLPLASRICTLSAGEMACPAVVFVGC